MEFFKKTTQIRFMEIRRTTAIFSAVLFLVSIISLTMNGLNWSLDFTGGVVVEMQFKQAPSLQRIRADLENAGFKDTMVQVYGSPKDVLLRFAADERDASEKMAEKIKTAVGVSYQDFILKRVDVVGPQVGKALAEKGALAVIVAMLLTMLYILLRFEHRFAIAAAVGLLHDPILILGIFSMFHIEFDLPTLAAILAVIGYSLNDSVVVFDRVKENFIKIRKSTPDEIMNLSINQTLSRTLMTSGLTLLVVIALLFYGGPSIFGFSLALLIGIVIGTYSSIYVSGALSVVLGLTREDLIPQAKQIDETP